MNAEGDGFRKTNNSPTNDDSYMERSPIDGFKTPEPIYRIQNPIMALRSPQPPPADINPTQQNDSTIFLRPQESATFESERQTPAATQQQYTSRTLTPNSPRITQGAPIPHFAHHPNNGSMEVQRCVENRKLEKSPNGAPKQHGKRGPRGPNRSTNGSSSRVPVDVSSWVETQQLRLQSSQPAQQSVPRQSDEQNVPYQMDEKTQNTVKYINDFIKETIEMNKGLQCSQPMPPYRDFSGPLGAPIGYRRPFNANHQGAVGSAQPVVGRPIDQSLFQHVPNTQPNVQTAHMIQTLGNGQYEALQNVLADAQLAQNGGVGGLARLPNNGPQQNARLYSPYQVPRTQHLQPQQMQPQQALPTTPTTPNAHPQANLFPQMLMNNTPKLSSNLNGIMPTAAEIFWANALVSIQQQSLQQQQQLAYINQLLSQSNATPQLPFLPQPITQNLIPPQTYGRLQPNAAVTTASVFSPQTNLTNNKLLAVPNMFLPQQSAPTTQPNVQAYLPNNTGPLANISPNISTPSGLQESIIQHFRTLQTAGIPGQNFLAEGNVPVVDREGGQHQQQLEQQQQPGPDSTNEFGNGDQRGDPAN